jgi:hypothetical protein
VTAVCEFCGNDDATVQVCNDCLPVERSWAVPRLAKALASALGGPVDDWMPIAEEAWADVFG